MKTKLNTLVCHAAFFALALILLDTNLSVARAQGTAFTYQGRFSDGGGTASGNYDLTFTLFGVSSGGNAIAGPLTNASVGVANGLFTVTLDFGNPFPGADRWLEIGVRTNGSSAFTILIPRQRITSTPYAIQTANAASAVNVSGLVSAGQLTGTIPAENIGAGTITSIMLAPNSVHSNHLSLGNIHSNHLALGSIHSNHFSLGSIHSNHLAAASIHSNHLAAGSIHSNALALGSVTASALASGSIHSNHLSAGSVHSNALIIGSIHSNHLSLGSIHSNHLSLASIHSNHLSAGSIHSNALALGSVTAHALANGTIHSNHLAAGSVHSNALVIGGIHSNHLAVGIIHSNHLAAGSVHSNALALGSVTAVALASGSIHSNHLAAGSVHSNALVIGSIHSNHLSAGSIHSNALALGSVTASALAIGSIHSNHFAAGSIHSNALALGSVTATALASDSIHSNHLAVGAVSPNNLISSLSGSFSTSVTNPTVAFFENFGIAVAGVGTDKLIVGEYLDSTAFDNAGAAHLFNTSGTFLRTFLSPVPQNQEHFGFAVASLGQDKVLIGADGNFAGGLDSGAAYLFRTNGTLITTFTNPTPAASDFFGYSVATVGADKVLIGAHGDHFGANVGGAAYLLTTNRTLLTTFTNPTPASGDRFGVVVTAVGVDQVLIGADRDDSGATDAGVAYLFHISGTLLAPFTNPTPAVGDAFGTAVTAVGLDKLLIGAPGDNSGGNAGGAAYLFNTSGTLLMTLTNPTPASGDQFGVSVAAVDANHVLIGASSDDAGATDAGAVYLFTTAGTLLSTFHNPAPANGDRFGNAVAAVGTAKILIGAFEDDASPTDSGSAHLFALEPFTPGLVADTVRDGAITAAKLDSTIGVWTRAGNDLYRAAGNVGIGTTSPQTPLHVLGNNSQLRLQDSSLGNYWSIYTENHPVGADGNLVFVSGPSGASAFIRKTDGNYFSSSDARLKQEVRDLSGVLDRVLQLRPVSYRFKSAPESAPRTIGLIAQDVEPLFPEAVGEHNGMKSLAYSELVPVTVGAIQELNQKSEERALRLEQELKRRAAENAELKQTVNELKEVVKAINQKLDRSAKITPAAR